jgi:hypothetical protein
MAKEALEACCPNVGPPAAEEIIEQPPIEHPPVEQPPELPPETPPETPPELPPPPGRNGVAPRDNGALPPATIPPMPTTRPAIPPEESTQSFLRSRADRMAATSRRRPAQTVRGGQNGNHTARTAPQPLASVPGNSQGQTAPAASHNGARLVISDEGNSAATGQPMAAASVSDGLPSAAQPSKQGGLRIRATENHEQAAAPKSSRMWPAATSEPASTSGKRAQRPSTQSSGEGNVVRIRDSADDLQLASAQEPEVATLKLRAVDSGASQAMISDLFAPPPAVQQPKSATNKQTPSPQATKPAAPASRSAAAVKPPMRIAKPRGQVSDIDVRAGVVRFKFNADHAPQAGTMVKVYHQFLLGEDCVGALEVTSVKNGVATARPVGNLSLNRLSLDDQVNYQSSGSASVAANGYAMFAAP